MTVVLPSLTVSNAQPAIGRTGLDGAGPRLEPGGRRTTVEGREPAKPLGFEATHPARPQRKRCFPSPDVSSAPDWKPPMAETVRSVVMIDRLNHES